MYSYFFGSESTKPDPTPGVPAIDAITKITGLFGTYQLRLCFLIFICKFFIAFHQMAIIFLSPKIHFTCDGEVNKCPCDNPEYNRSVFTNTIGMQWDLICNKAWLGNFSQSMFQLGTLVGSLFFGIISDRFGRKKPLLGAVVLQIVTSVLAAFVNNYYLFTFIRLLVGVSVGGTMVTSFVILMEFIGTKYRGTMSAVYQFPHTMGHMLLPLFSYFFRDYFHFQLMISVPALIMLIYFCLIPETPRWLIAKGRTDDAIKILTKCAKVNNLPTGNINEAVHKYQADVERSKLELKRKGTALDLFRTANQRKNILGMSFLWFTTSYCYYGVTQYVGQLTGIIFLNVLISAIFSFVGALIAIPLIKYLGRRTICIAFNFIAGICLFIVAILEIFLGTHMVGTIVFATIGVMASFITFITAYLYCGELFPTVVRNAALGFSSMMARVGSMIAPCVLNLEDVAFWLPPFVFGVFPMIAGIISFLLPETKDHPLTTTLAESEKFGKDNQSKLSKILSRKTADT